MIVVCEKCRSKLHVDGVGQAGNDRAKELGWRRRRIGVGAQNRLAWFCGEACDPKGNEVKTQPIESSVDADEQSNANDVLDVNGAMALLHVGRNAVYEMCAQNRIPHRRIGIGRGNIRFSRGALLRWLEGER